MSQEPPAPVVTMIDPTRTPSPKARTLWAINAALMWAVVAITEIVWAVVLSVNSDDPAWWPNLSVAAVTIILAVVHITVVPSWRYRVHRWEISETAVYSRTGWFDQEWRVAPISRVQTVDTERGPIDRALGLSTVTITTASSAGAVKISALDKVVADETVALLTEIAARTRGDAT
ncbi:PH domain-containing protein [Rhodococcoides trifolii]|nr:PH domain-containing protein [Rhodococcus trifolii]